MTVCRGKSAEDAYELGEVVARRLLVSEVVTRRLVNGVAILCRGLMRGVIIDHLLCPNGCVPECEKKKDSVQRSSRLIFIFLVSFSSATNED